MTFALAHSRSRALALRIGLTVLPTLLSLHCAPSAPAGSSPQELWGIPATATGGPGAMQVAYTPLPGAEIASYRVVYWSDGSDRAMTEAGTETTLSITPATAPFGTEWTVVVEGRSSGGEVRARSALLRAVMQAPEWDGGDKHPKISSTLWDEVVAEAERQKELKSLSGTPSRSPLVKALVFPWIGRSPKSVDVAGIEAAEGTVTGGTADHLRIEVPLARLAALADLPSVRYVREPYARQSVTESQGVALTAANTLHAAGKTGAGVKVAIIDLGFQGLTAAINAGELPAYLLDGAHGVDFGTAGLQTSTSHGTGVAEVVHDMAPDAELFVYKVSDDTDLTQAKDACIANGVKVANHSVSWVNSSFYDGTGPISAIVNAATTGGVLWCNAAGNYGRRHWTGSWVDADGDKKMEFKANDEGLDVSGGSNTTAQIFVNWNQYPTTCNDYDVYIYDKSGVLVTRSLTRQGCTQPPEEAVAFTYSSTKAPYQLQIRRYSGSGTARFHVFSFNHDFGTESLAASSLTDPAAAFTAFSVAAMDVAVWAGARTIESFSSQGPTSDGRTKPDLTGPDGNANYTYGSFYGTSSASPHVAGAAAVVFGMNPGAPPAAVAAILEGNASDLGAAGKDSTFGAGQLRLVLPATGCTGDAACGDNNACNGSETCDVGTGQCRAGTPLNCSDGDACNGAETCNAQTGQCAAGTPVSCNDGNPCNGVETCNAQTGQCAAGTALLCSDGNACNGVETCNPLSGQCAAGTALSCNDGNACNGVETCNAQTGCVVGTAISCGDGNACNGAESCNAQTGLCQAGTPISCGDGNACNGAESCNAQTGQCQAGAAPACGVADGCCGSGCTSANDTDCAPVCKAKNASCTANSQCCSGLCSRYLFWKTCK